MPKAAPRVLAFPPLADRARRSDTPLLSLLLRTFVTRLALPTSLALAALVAFGASTARASGGFAPPASESAPVGTEAASVDAGASSEAPDPSEAREAPDAGEASDSPKARARRGFKRGVEAAQAGNYVEAAAAFEASYEAIPAANTLFNVGWAYEHAERWVEAVVVYRRYLAEYGDAADAVEVERALVRLEARVSELDIDVEGASGDVELRIDGERYALEQLPVLRLPGEVFVQIRDADGREREEAILLRPGQRRTVSLTFLESETGNGGELGPVDETPPERIERPWARPLMWSGVALAGTGAVGIGVFGSLTLVEARRFENGLCAESTCEGETNPSYPADEEARFQAYRRTSNVMIGVAATGAAVALVFGLLDMDARRRNAMTDRAAQRAEARRVRWSVQPGGLRLRF